MVSSFGSVISLVSIMVFFYMVYDALKKQILFRGWGDGVETLEWVQVSPPEWHTYSEAPYVWKKCGGVKQLV